MGLNYKKLGMFCLTMFFGLVIQAQNGVKSVEVDQEGVMRYTQTGKEVHGFGVNYTAPFAHAFRSSQKMGLDIQKEIQKDVYYFKRLGFDLYRIHVWDTEISDSLGNLLESPQLEAFDFLIAELKRNQIHYVLTPIAFWGDGWPEPDGDTPGFSHKYGKGNCLINPDAIAAQENYLEQFLNHKNKFTGIAYKNDPDLLAVEISNEPHHRGEPKQVADFVEKMVKAVRKSGFQNPVFYNVSHAVQYMENYFQAGIDGGTFQWYPTGLGYQQPLPGNFLPNVDRYEIPFDDVIKKYHGAKLVYEFDAADVNESYMIPAMARSFREAGIQIATHFAYDPTFLGPYNTEYNTHYMNLIYSPKKALSLMIAGEIFHQLPMGQNHGNYPENTSFLDFKIESNQKRSLLNSEEKFIYTDGTNSSPKNERKLKLIAGTSNSPLVSYTGSGAYFLDKLGAGMWRLEVNPDVITVNNIYGRNSLEKKVAVIQNQKQTIQLKLADLSGNFSVIPLNEGNKMDIKVANQSFDIQPGVYLIKRNDLKKEKQVATDINGYAVSTYFGVKTNVDQLYLTHQPLKEWTSGRDYKIKVSIANPDEIDEVKVYGNSGNSWFEYPLAKMNTNFYQVNIPSEKLNEGYLFYHLVVKMSNGEYRTFPENRRGRHFDWDFYDRNPYSVRIITSDFPVQLFDAETDSKDLVHVWKPEIHLAPEKITGKDEYRIVVKNLFTVDSENIHATPIYDFSILHFLNEEMEARRDDLTQFSKVAVLARSLSSETEKVQIAFILKTGIAYGAIVELNKELKEYNIPLSEFKEVQTVIQPRPYPTFLPYFFEHDIQQEFDLNEMESLQIRIGPGLNKEEQQAEHQIGIISIKLK